MTKLLIHPITDKKLEAFTNKPSHALILVGPTGSGKLSLAKKIAETVLEIPTIAKYPYGLFIEPTNNNISIEVIRQIEHFLSLKVPGANTYKRAIIIEQAEKLSIEAQNALLKNLEEPPSDTIFILTVSHTDRLLPTLRSRSQTILINQPDIKAVREMLSNIDSADFNRAYSMSGGRPGLLNAILNNIDHPLKQASECAKQLLSGTTYDRLLLVDKLARNPELAGNVTSILQHMAHVSLQNAKGSNFKRWQSILNASYKASEALANNGQPKLVLTSLMMNL
jgi:hypothetical protein